MKRIDCASTFIRARIQEFSSGGGGGGGAGGLGQSDNVFLVLSLFYRSQMVNFKETFHFSRFEWGSNISQGVQLFPGGGGGGPIAYSLLKLV